MQTRLLELPDPSLDDVVKAAQAMDAAAKDAGEMARATGSPSAEAVVNKMTTKGGTCSRCGGDHSSSQCQFSQAQCFTCGKPGTSHGFSEGGGRTADRGSILGQAQVPHKPAVRVAVASVRDGDVRQQARVLQRPGSTSWPKTRQSSRCDTQALFRRLCHRIC
ncbi:hypothetical protein HPB49_003492 [Dermacentor silvarum]|uniref:Uncharacterized protein n=1 Tax=Dermacentor silvarum TaxID=543639 RepID=A0ACB8DUH2_DERSI|nr:hypothetical protein HPB49_003492 [Dermacentor silvarum]